VGVQLTTENCLETTGLRLDEMVAHHFSRRPWEGTSQERVGEMILDGMEGRLRASPIAMPGLEECIAFFRSKGVPLAVASSSPMRLISAALEGLGLTDTFSHVCSATAEEFGKPHPAVYISAARALGVEPTDCLALEDSLNGAIAAKAAKMKCIAVPDTRHAPVDLTRFAFNDAVLGSLAEVDDALWARLGGGGDST